jgi:hypothetical protein
MCHVVYVRARTAATVNPAPHALFPASGRALSAYKCPPPASAARPFLSFLPRSSATRDPSHVPLLLLDLASHHVNPPPIPSTPLARQWRGEPARVSSGWRIGAPSLSSGGRRRQGWRGRGRRRRAAVERRTSASTPSGGRITSCTRRWGRASAPSCTARSARPSTRSSP